MVCYKSIIVNGRKIDEHRYIMELLLNRNLRTEEVVHHINGNIRDNRPENLRLMSNKGHAVFHAKIRTKLIEYIKLKCYHCKNEFTIRKSRYKTRKKHGQIRFFCSKNCRSKNTCKKVKPPINKITEEKIIIIKQEMKNGLTGYKIAKKHKLCPRTVYKYMKLFN